MIEVIVMWGWVPGVLALGFCVWLLRRLRTIEGAQVSATADFRGEYESNCQAFDARMERTDALLEDLQHARDQQQAILTRNAAVRSVRQEVLSHLRGGMQADAVSRRMELPRNEVRLLARVQGILASSIEAR